MKNLSPKVFIYAILTSILFFSANVISAEPKVTKNITIIEKNVYLNKSTIDDLVTLKGIGQKKAQAILSYRKKIGEFTSVAELTNIKGIGEKVLIDNKKRLKI